MEAVLKKGSGDGDGEGGGGVAVEGGTISRTTSDAVRMADATNGRRGAGPPGKRFYCTGP